MKWRKLEFRDVLTMNRRPYELGSTEDANLVGMRLYGVGPFHREHKPAHRIRKKSHFVIKTGDIIYNKLFAWKGTFGIVPTQLDGMFVSDKFPTYKLDDSQVYPPFLTWYFRLPKVWDRARRQSRGSAALSKLTLNPPQFLELPLLLPSLEEQKSISETLDASMSRLKAAWEIRKRPSMLLFGRSMSIGQEGRLLLRSALSQLEQDCGGTLATLDDVLFDTLRSGPSFPVSNEGTGVAVAMPSCVGSFQFSADRISYGVYDSSVQDKDYLRRGDILFSRGNKTDHVGTCAVFPGHADPITYANLFMRVRVDPDGYDVEFVQSWLMTPLVRKHVRKHTKGTSPTVQKINSTGVKSIPFPVGISIARQREWADRLKRIRTTCDAIERCAVESANRLEVLPRVIVNDIFRIPWQKLVS